MQNVQDLKQFIQKIKVFFRGGSRTAATSKMARFVIIVNGWKPLTIITKRSTLHVAAVLDPSLFFMQQDPAMILAKLTKRNLLNELF